MKKCTICGYTKELDQFYKSNSSSDGTINQCKDCVKSRVRQRAIDKADYIREYEKGRANLPHRVKLRRDYASTELGRIKGNEAKLRYIDKNPKVRRAHCIVSNALRDGAILKPQECEKCGNDDRIEGHHCDYDQPLKIMWLCSQCHNQWHKENGEGLNK